MSDEKKKTTTKRCCLLDGNISDWVPTDSKEYHLVADNERMIWIEKQVDNMTPDDVQGIALDEADSASSSQVPVAPDGGYGWIIVLASFIIHFICDGISFSYGIMFPEIQEYFKATKTMSGLVGSIFLSIPLLSGPLAGALTDIYDCRRMTIIGGVVAAGGAFLSFFAFNIWHFLFSFAVITGIGLSFCFNTAIVAVTYYFQKKRAIATGIAVCGSGAGTFVLAPFIEVLFTNCGWRTTLLGISTLLVFLVGCGVLIKDLEWPQDTIEYKRKKFIEKTERERLRMAIRNPGDDASIFTMDFAHVGFVPRRAISVPAIPTYAEPYLQISDQTPNIQSVKAAVNELQHVPVAKSRSMGEFLHSPANDATREPKHVPDVELVTQSGLAHLDLKVSCGVKLNASPKSSRRAWSDASYSVDAGDLTSNIGDFASDSNIRFGKRSFSIDGDDSSDDVVGRETTHDRLDLTKLRTAVHGNFSQDNVTKQPLLSNEVEKRKLVSEIQAAKNRTNTALQDVVPVFSSRAVRSSCMATSLGGAQGRVPAANVLNFRWKFEPFGDGMYRRIPSAPAIYYRRKRKRRAVQLSKMWESFLEWISDTKLLLVIPEFAVFLLSTFVLYIFFDIPYVNFPEYAVENHNITETDASYLVSGIGLTNMVSMLFCGFIADWGQTRQYVMQMYGIFITLAGLCVVMAPFVRTYMQLMSLCIGFGFFISANYTLASVITVHVLCLYDFQTGYGILCLVEGLGNLIGPAMVGFIRDNLSGYDNIFLLGGAGIMVSGIMVIFIDIFIRLCDTNGGKDSVRNNRNDIESEHMKVVRNGVAGSHNRSEKTSESDGHAVLAALTAKTFQ